MSASSLYIDRPNPDNHGVQKGETGIEHIDYKTLLRRAAATEKPSSASVRVDAAPMTSHVGARRLYRRRRRPLSSSSGTAKVELSALFISTAKAARLPHPGRYASPFRQRTRTCPSPPRLLEPILISLPHRQDPPLRRKNLSFTSPILMCHRRLTT